MSDTKLSAWEEFRDVTKPVLDIVNPEVYSMIRTAFLSGYVAGYCNCEKEIGPDPRLVKNEI